MVIVRSYGFSLDCGQTLVLAAAKIRSGSNSRKDRCEASTQDDGQDDLSQQAVYQNQAAQDQAIRKRIDGADMTVLINIVAELFTQENRLLLVQTFGELPHDKPSVSNTEIITSLKATGAFSHSLSAQLPETRKF